MIAKTPASWREIGNEPAPIFATATEIEIAERLRHELEERYFGFPDAHAALPVQADDVH